MKEFTYKIKKNSIFIKKASFSMNVLLGLFKIILAILSQSILLFIYSFYNGGMIIAKKTSIRENQKYKYENFYLVGIIVLLSSIAYILYSNYIYFNGINTSYHMYIALGIATLSFYNITVAIIGIIKAKKKKNIQMETIKLTNLASAFISLSLTQTAILSFSLEGNNSQYYGIGGIFFGVLAATVGLYMIIYTFSSKRNELISKN